ncbi:hypothetical protein BgiBS90_006091, partial [Biomphalaria glabrata]
MLGKTSRQVNVMPGLCRPDYGLNKPLVNKTVQNYSECRKLLGDRGRSQRSPQPLAAMRPPCLFEQ